MSQYLVSAIAAADNVDVVSDSELVEAARDGRIQRVSVRNRMTADVAELRTDGLFVMIGAEARLDWLPTGVGRDQRGYVLTGAEATSDRHPRDRALFPFETNNPGVFAVGDVRSGSVKRVASAVGEGSVVVQQIHQYLTSKTPGQFGSQPRTLT